MRPVALGGFAATCLAKAVLDGASARGLRPGGFCVRHLALVPAKDLILGGAWTVGLVRRDVAWRGTRLRVLPGTRIALPGDRATLPVVAGTRAAA